VGITRNWRFWIPTLHRGFVEYQSDKSHNPHVLKRACPILHLGLWFDSCSQAARSVIQTLVGVWIFGDVLDVWVSTRSEWLLNSSNWLTVNAQRPSLSFLLALCKIDRSREMFCVPFFWHPCWTDTTRGSNQTSYHPNLHSSRLTLKRTRASTDEFCSASIKHLLSSRRSSSLTSYPRSNSILRRTNGWFSQDERSFSMVLRYHHPLFFGSKCTGPFFWTKGHVI